jgi:hypothetical protein
MIKIEQPAMALNATSTDSYNVPGAHYQMWNTWAVAKTNTPEHMAGWIASVASGAPGGYLKGLILNCHGRYSIGPGTPAVCLPANKGPGTGGFGLSMGTGIKTGDDIDQFKKLKGLVAGIWITACGAARITIPGALGSGDGNLFCSALAKASGSYVYAAVVEQYGANSLPFGYIDDYTGLVLRYTPTGGVDWSGTYANNGVPC